MGLMTGAEATKGNGAAGVNPHARAARLGSLSVR